MVDRKWMPSEFMDEVVPPARANPDEWITKMDDGAPALASGRLEDDDGKPGRALSDGEIVEFDWIEIYGSRDLTFNKSEDGWTWTLDGEEPGPSPGGDMTIAEVGNWESMMPTLSEFAETYSENGVDDGETITIVFYAWSRNSVPYVFRNGVFHASAEQSAAVN